MKQRRILVVDDERSLCDILLYNLSMAGYEAVAAFSAEEALEKEPGGFDLILLDVMLPGLSGYELAQKLKTDTVTSGIPIVFLSAMGAEDDKLHGFELGADDYIPKPSPFVKCWRGLKPCWDALLKPILLFRNSAMKVSS